MDTARKSVSARIVVGLLAIAALIALGWFAWTEQARRQDGPPTPAASDLAEFQRLPGRPDLSPPEDEPVVAMETARKLNAAIPFLAAKLAPAKAFRFAGSEIDRTRAIDCLALAALAEAGGSDDGQRAVIQVMLNRVRHPAFPATVCGVVFQGSERVTGCQFSFTCDGSLARSYSEAARALARKRAKDALGGRVFAKVGNATHYHTDWVHPWWSAKLDKIAQVETHLFLRWKGYWGQSASVTGRYRGGESSLDELVGRAHRPDVQPDALPTPQPAATGGSLTAGEGAGDVVVAHPDGGAFLIQLRPRASAGEALAVARRLCGGNGYCHVMGWSDRSAIPRGFPVPPAARAKMKVSYVLDDQNREVVTYDCAAFPATPADRCLRPPAQ